MTTVFCRHCGHRIHHAALVCPHCGHAQISTAPGELMPAGGNFPGVSANVLVEWGRRFHLIQKAGGPSLSMLRRLGWAERVSVFFNFWALLLGPVYYLRLGMWKRAVALSAFSALLAGLLCLSTGSLQTFGSVSVILTVVFTWRANRDYYRKAVLGYNGWW